ncbi:MAG: NrfD/PsrC family molybdoenzyme membrane anchor subunit [Thermoanaerobaculia bacterium]
MKERIPSRVSEARLDQLRQEAEIRGRVKEPGIRPLGAPFPQATPEHGYYGLPLLKKPTWKWEIPAYFFVGGAAGAAAVVGAAAQLSGDERLVREARWVAAAGATLSAPLLVSDLGRPERFLAMLRVFKLQSPMSVGAWTLTAFGSTSAAAAFAKLIEEKSEGRTPVRILGDAAAALSAATGLGMATYTGVLVGATAIPVWQENVRLLPLHFGASALASAVSLLELLGNRNGALNALGFGAAVVETGVGAVFENETGRAFKPLKEGESGTITRIGGVLSGPAPLLLRLASALVGSGWRLRQAAAVSSLAGSLITRYAWLEAGKESAKDPTIPLEIE